MDLKKMFGTDITAEKEGVWYDLGNGAQIKVARLGNENNKRVSKRISTPYKFQIQRGTLSDDVQLQLSIAAIAESILIDWKGLIYDGVAIEYSVDNAIKLLTELKDFRDQVIVIANDLELFRQKEVQAEEKN